MRPNPLHDAGHFLIQPGWFTPVFWLLLLGSAALAVLAWRIEPAQRSPRAVGLWVLRGLVGTMWWQQSLWKIPPNFGGLRYWMQQEAAHAAIGVSLLLGLLSRLGALLGVLMGLNLWLGLYSAPGEWPWTYMFLLIIQALFVIDPPGRVLGADVWLGRAAGRAGWRGVGLSWVA